MKTLHEYKEEGKRCFDITERRPFNVIAGFSEETVETVLEFAYNMSFGKAGEHRNHRSGGQTRRKPGEVFRDTFQGKLAEYGVHHYLNTIKIKSPEPSLEVWKLGKWDITDIKLNGKDICIKSAKYFANLLLLETKDWDDKGNYIPNLQKTGGGYYDLFVLVRIKPSLEEIMRGARILYRTQVEKDTLSALIIEEEWEYDIPGLATHEQVAEIIDNGFILPQNSYLNGKTKMDAENYYIQSGDLLKMSKIGDYI